VILPVTFEYVDGEVMIRTFRGQKFGAAQAHQHVAFEVDDWDAELRTGWSVLIKGRAETVVEWAKARAADDLDLEPYAGAGEHEPWIRIMPRTRTRTDRTRLANRSATTVKAAAAKKRQRSERTLAVTARRSPHT